MNEQHTLLVDQETQLSEMWDFSEVEKNLVSIPATGLTYNQQITIADSLTGIILFVSPLPAMMSYLAQNNRKFLVFHNDKREKKELPNGKIIFTVAKTGWGIV